MAEGKWITELTPSTPLADAARRALSLRLQVVHDYLPLAIRESDKDLEYVHQLRVGTRRAGAALDIFALCLPAREFQKARKHLRRIRRAAGAARDWDVFLASLPTFEKTIDRRWRTHDLLTGYGLSQRTTAQAQLEQASPNFPFDFERLMAETVAAVHRPHTHPDMVVLRDLAQPLLARLLRELHRAATENLNDYDHLHQVRILGKRLRYAMEIVADCFAPAFRSALYPMVEEMQEILGAANDSHVATQRLELLRAQLRAVRPSDWRRYRFGVEAMLRYHRERVPQQRELFVEWWGRWETAGGEEAFRALLKAAEQPAEPAASAEPPH